MKTEIGIATIICEEDGTIINADFTATMELQNSDKLVDELKKMEGPPEDKAGLIFANWFNKVSEIEMADRDKQKVVTTNLGTTQVPNTTMHSTRFLFTFEDV